MSSQQHDPANVNNPEHSEHHIIGPKIYTIVYVSLLILTLVTVKAAFIDLGVFNPILAVAIACLKATVVILFFMHVFYQSKLIKLTVASGFFTFLILVSLTLSDYISRAWGLW